MSSYRPERGSKMIKSIKRMILTGAAVMVMMSFAAPAMAADLTDYIVPNATYTASKYSSVYEWLFKPDIGTAGDQIPVEAGGTPPNNLPNLPDGSVVVGPSPIHRPDLGIPFECWISNYDADGDLTGWTNGCLHG
jgi:hypothetical protein